MTQVRRVNWDPIILVLFTHFTHVIKIAKISLRILNVLTKDLLFRFKI